MYWVWKSKQFCRFHGFHFINIFVFPFICFINQPVIINKCLLVSDTVYNAQWNAFLYWISHDPPFFCGWLELSGWWFILIAFRNENKKKNKNYCAYKQAYTPLTTDITIACCLLPVTIFSNGIFKIKKK